MDKKRLNKEEAQKITQGEIDAWHRGKLDALRNKLLNTSRQLSPDKAVTFIKAYATSGDLHHLSVKFDIPLDVARNVLKAFDISSIEDARKVVRDGIISELDAANTQKQEEDRLDRLQKHTEAEARLEAYEQSLGAPKKTEEELDKLLAERRSEAQFKNKQDKLRELIADGIDPKNKDSQFRIPLSQISSFKKMIPGGVSYLRRQFGGSRRDIINEVKRLAPEFDVDMLRP